MFIKICGKSSYTHYIGLLSILLFLATGCATFKPQTMTCASLGSEQISNKDFRVGYKIFSVLPPRGENWCLRSTGDPTTIVYGTSKFIGKYLEQAPPKEEMLHTFGVMANTVKVKDVDIMTSTEIKKFMERWFYDSGQSFTWVGGQRYAEFTPMESSERFEPIQFKVEVDDTFGANCVRFESKQEEKNNPRVRNWIFTLNNSGVACRHPDTSRLLVMVTFSERHRKGSENYQLANKFKTEAERTIQSLQFVKTQ